MTDPSLDPGNYVMALMEVPVCLACADDDHQTCYGGLCHCPCGGEEVDPAEESPRQWGAHVLRGEVMERMLERANRKIAELNGRRR